MAEVRVEQNETRPDSDNGEGSEATLQGQKRRRSFMICGHCDRALTKSTYYRHKRCFFNPVSGTWLRIGRLTKEELESVSTQASGAAAGGSCPVATASKTER